jgi:hypothetical protein
MEMQSRSRESLLTAVSARLERAGAIWDLSPVLEPGASFELLGLAFLINDDEEDWLARFAIGWMHWYRHQALAAGTNSDELTLAIAALAPCFVAGIEGLPADLEPILAEQSVATADNILPPALDSTDPGVPSHADPARGDDHHTAVGRTAFDEYQNQVRALPGLEHFLAAVPYASLTADLRAAAVDGPVVIVNASRHGCHALIAGRFQDR